MPFKEFDRICQMVVVPHYDYTKVNYRDILTGSERGEGGLGHSGVE
jgi:dUTPase